MQHLKTFLSGLIIQKNPTYVGIFTRVFVVLIFQGFFRISPFNFQARHNASATVFILMVPLLIGTYSLLIAYAFQAVIRFGAVTETPSTPRYEKIIAVIVLVIAIILFLYSCLTTPPGIPWYLE